MSGPRPKPTKLKLLAGERRKQRLNLDEPQFAAEMPAMPERLDEVARAKWEELGPVLFRVGVLTEADGDVLGVYCEQFARYVQLEAELDRTGFWIEGSQGQDVRNPLIGDCRQQANLLRQLEAELGITPSARTRVKALPKGASNKFEQVG